MKLRNSYKIPNNCEIIDSSGAPEPEDYKINYYQVVYKFISCFLLFSVVEIKLFAVSLCCFPFLGLVDATVLISD